MSGQELAIELVEPKKAMVAHPSLVSPVSEASERPDGPQVEIVRTGAISPAITTPWTPIDGNQVKQPSLSSFGGNGKAVQSPRPVSKDVFRPMTASTKRLSFTGIPERSIRIKYGTEKFAGVELSPQPSDDPDDPLNWPLWKKNLNFLALLYMVTMVGLSKLAFVSVNTTIATTQEVSYTHVMALTAIPLMLSSVTGFLSMIVARVFGKRPIYLVSAIAIYIGCLWSISGGEKYGQTLASRVFQGLGWGAFDTLVLASVQDTYFEHERESRIIMHNVVSIAATWGAPLIGGVLSATSHGFSVQFQVLTAFIFIGVILVIFGAPETAFHANFKPQARLLSPSQAMLPRVTLTLAAIKKYMGKLKPWSYKSPAVSRALILQAPRAMVAPTTVMLFLVTLLPYAALWSLTSSLSLLFSIMPFMLPSQSIGALLTGPFIMATAAAIAVAAPFFTKRFTPTVHLATVSVASGLASIGILSFGLYLDGCMKLPDNNNPTDSTLWSLDFVGAQLSFPLVSFLLGFVAFGAIAINGTARPMIQRSTAFTSSCMTVALRNTADMQGALTCWRNMVVGAFVLGIPDAVWSWDGLKMTTIGLGVAQLGVAAAAAFVWSRWDESVRKLDGLVMSLVDLSDLNKAGSFFDMD